MKPKLPLAISCRMYRSSLTLIYGRMSVSFDISGISGTQHGPTITEFYGNEIKILEAFNRTFATPQKWTTQFFTDTNKTRPFYFFDVQHSTQNEGSSSKAKLTMRQRGIFAKHLCERKLGHNKCSCEQC